MNIAVYRGDLRKHLVRLAMEVPARGREADDWRTRGLAEVLVHAAVTGDGALVDAVDEAVAHVPNATPRFSDRINRLRAMWGAVPRGYPGPSAARPLAPATPLEVQRAAVTMARFADNHVPRAVAGDGPPSLTDATRTEWWLRRTAPLRGCEPESGVCVDTELPSDLLWRAWLLDGMTPVLAVPSGRHTDVEVAMMSGLHVGFHLDHLAALVATGRVGAATRLQFGAGLLIAESAVMAAELAALADREHVAEAQRAFLWRAVVDRLSRIPGIEHWGRAALPGSQTMAAATVVHPEFHTLPTLAAAYVAGPFRLAARGFRHPLLPMSITGFLDSRWVALVRH